MRPLVRKRLKRETKGGIVPLLAPLKTTRKLRCPGNRSLLATELRLLLTLPHLVV